MEISFTPEVQSFVKSQVSSGLYTSEQDLLNDAIKLMIEQDRLIKQFDSINHDIDVGLADSSAGRLVSAQKLKDGIKDLFAKFTANNG